MMLPVVVMDFVVAAAAAAELRAEAAPLTAVEVYAGEMVH